MNHIPSDHEPLGTRPGSPITGSRTSPVPTTSGIFPVWLREDLTREAALQYWKGPHAQIVARLPSIAEYLQHHFSPTDHGYWPASPTVGTAVPPSWRCDGIAEVRMVSMAGALTIPVHMREVYLDEQNVFDRVLGNLTGPRAGRWWTDGHDAGVGHRTVLLLRRRRGVSRRPFRRYVHDRIGPALHEAGAHDLRTYTFLPWTSLPHPTPGISHDNPTFRRYHGCVVLGADSRAAMEEILTSKPVAGLVADQHTVMTAVHAFTVEHTEPVIRTGPPVRP
ncbi:EthD domain-containing protein [Streptomyces sp. NPDC001663]|uniref:EthD domain-containing protein n=1 Tax=Streptomyces sp. NPDC001663 TaxID=3364597 RepID=UPI00368E7788